MKKLIHLICILFLSLASITVKAQKDTAMNSGILYGSNYSYTLSAPDGWVMDNQAGVSQGLSAVFYPHGSSWVDGVTVMYTNYASYDTTKKENMQSVIDTDKVTFKKNNPSIVIKQEKDISIGKSNKKIVAAVYSFRGDSYNNYESVAYIPSPTGVAFVIITSRSENEYKKYYPDFVKLVQSYFWLSSDVKVGK